MYRFEVDLSEVQDAMAVDFALLAERASLAVRAVGEEVSWNWKEAVRNAHLWESEKQAYLDAISMREIGPLEVEVVTTYEHAKAIESGRSERDLKENIRRSKSARQVSKGPHAGQLYLIIPFQHNVPSASGKGALAPQMPRDIYRAAKQLPLSRVLPSGSRKAATRLSATGHVVPQHSYSWGGRLPAGLAPKMKAHHKTDPYSGMVRFDTSAGKAKSSSYLTFRTMGEWSSGWVVPPRPGQHLLDGVVSGLDTVLREAIEMAVAKGE